MTYAVFQNDFIQIRTVVVYFVIWVVQEISPVYSMIPSQGINQSAIVISVTVLAGETCLKTDDGSSCRTTAE